MMVKNLLLFVFAYASSLVNASEYRKANLDNFIEFAKGGDHGYVDESLSNNQFRIKYIGSQDSDYPLLKKFLLQRATELCDGEFSYSGFVESISVVAHRIPIENKYVQAKVTCK